MQSSIYIVSIDRLNSQSPKVAYGVAAAETQTTYIYVVCGYHSLQSVYGASGIIDSHMQHDMIV